VRNIDLDIPAAILCGVVALCLFTLHIVTSPKRKLWKTPPEHLRRGLLASGVLFMLRSVNFTALPDDGQGLGHINAEGMLLLITLTYTAIAGAVWVVSKIMPAHGWDRLSHAEQRMHEDPDQVPVMMTMDEAVDTARLMGTHAVHPGGGPEELRANIIRGRK
jgi:hypothetical protein